MASYSQITQESVRVESIKGRASVVDNRLAIDVGSDMMFSNEIVIPRQRYPGEVNPALPDWEEFPLPDQVGKYGTRAEFLRAPKWTAQWVHFPERLEAVMAGRYHDVRPLHFEGIFTLVCNFRCPHCSRRPTRTKWVEGGTWDNSTPVNSLNTLSLEGLKAALDQIARMRSDEYIGVIWGGGDPTSNPWVYDAMAYAKALGIRGSFLTNGVFLDVERVLDMEPILTRVSLNCGTEDVYRRFHGYPKDWDYFPRALRSIRLFGRRKLERKSRTLFGISLIVDERNLDDVVAATDYVRQVEVEEGPGAIDYVIARPVMNYSHFDHRFAAVRDGTKERALDRILSQVRGRLDSCDVPLVLIKDSFDPPPSWDFYEDLGTDCLAYGWASEVRHNGDVQLCSDSYGNPEYTVGNLFEAPLTEIWRSNRRLETLARINKKECFRVQCPHNSRGHHLNRIFHQVERFRREGRIDEVRLWAERLREVTLPLRHSFFL